VLKHNLVELRNQSKGDQHIGRRKRNVASKSTLARSLPRQDDALSDEELETVNRIKRKRVRRSSEGAKK
jgi:hypothetical protein